MLLIGLSSLLIACAQSGKNQTGQPLYSSTITPEFRVPIKDRQSIGSPNGFTVRAQTAISVVQLTRITSIILLFSAALSFNCFAAGFAGSLQDISAPLVIEDHQHGLGLFSGLFHVTTVTQFMEVFLFVVGAFILLPWASSSKTVLGSAQSSTSSSSTAVPSIAEYPLIVLFTTIGASFLISSVDLVSMYLSIELQSFAVYILAAIYRNSESATSAGLKYFLLGALSSALILLGSRIIYAYTGLTNFDSIYMVACSGISAAAGDPTTHAVVLGILIIGVGFLFKVAAAPFHNWAPDVYDGVPTIVTTWLTVMPKISLFVFLLCADFQLAGQIGSDATYADLMPQADQRSAIDRHSADRSADNSAVGSINIWKYLLLTTSLLSLVIGTVVGLAQYRLKRLLAFSTISHVGFLLLALAVNSEESITSFLFYLMQYSLTNVNAFFIVLALGYLIHSSNANTQSTDITFIAQLKGQFYANPILGLSFALCLFSMAGIPPLVGFFAKYMVLYSAIENGFYFIALVGILASVISASYYLRIIRVIFMDQLVRENKSALIMADHQSRHSLLSLSSIHSYVIAVLTLVITLFILSPSLFLNSSNLLALSLFTA